MKSMQKIVGFFFAMTIAAFALPATADSVTKTFNATFPTVVPTVGGGTVVAIPVIVNNTTPGVATINSIQIFPAAGVKFVSPYTDTGTLLGGAPQTTDGSLIIVNFPGIKSLKNRTFTLFANVSVNSCTQESWPKPSANAGNSLNGDTFGWNGTDAQLVSGMGCDGFLACDNSTGTNQAAKFAEGFVTGSRGQYNKDGSSCNAALYDVFADSANQKAGLFIDPVQPQAVTSATISWPARFVDSTGQLPVTQLAWQLDGNGNPIYHDGRACISPALPAPYGTLTQCSAAGCATGGTGGTPLAIQQADTVIHTAAAVVFATTPSATAPIPVVVDTERMNVIGQSGTALTVQRGQGGTAQVAHDLYYANTTTPKSLMSTPFPLDSNGIVMLVCITSETSETQTADQCTPPNPGSACVQKTTNVLGDWYSSDQ